MQAVPWAALEAADSDLANFGQERLDGKVAYLATLGSDGHPRVCPVTPVIGDGHIFIFVEPRSAKVKELLTAGAYCLHCAMNDSSGSSGEFLITGTAIKIEAPALRQEAESMSSFRPAKHFFLFELHINEALVTSYPGGVPKRSRWQVSLDSTTQAGCR